MFVAKQVADLITLSRALLAGVLVWLGVTRGAGSMPLVGWLMILDWLGDSLDGSIARRSRVQLHTWVGDHDLEIDILVSFGLLFYMLAAGLVHSVWAWLYLLMWGMIFWRWGLPRSLGMLVQAPIYGWFIWVSIHQSPVTGWWMLIFLFIMILVTWPRFPKEIVPDFLVGMQKALGGKNQQN